MPRLTAKICGLSTADTLAAAIKGGASHVGFVFFPKSPRNLHPEQAAALIAGAPDPVMKVGVFVDPDDALLDRAVATGLDAIQLHGAEPPERVAAIRARHGLELWKAVPVRTRADLAAAASYRGAADRILYDAKTPKGADLPGGMGLRFDWKLLDGFRHPLPWALSGGLDAGNVAEAAGITGARLVDVSSGVENAPGVKDVDKIAAFLQSVARI
ncbi:phosphoribosylanthranilate isomerase [Sphingomonas oleivorans]|uniref:N-(5'-phosphoribosyl)anthranilate isomerase n=1 Tax=Sphingomonas oleivorans TaxID=1735121 RepID=A0A2T5FTE3_9SPHN|nr:phosphoribosylanthranilate isomerase [Sphingomonas oleivorans]PTQ07336.1 phosphoribosylanthranilate isomerase [Sphingomonas oleivorans]